MYLLYTILYKESYVGVAKKEEKEKAKQSIAEFLTL